MSQTPMSRDSMRILRAQTLEEQRTTQIQRIVSQIYFGAVGTAKETSDARYLYELGKNPRTEFCRTNMSVILAELQTLFPDCSVKVATMTITPYGKMCDISKIDEQLRPYNMKQVRSSEYIVVDWS